MGKPRKKVQQPEFRSSKCLRRKKRKFCGSNRWTSNTSQTDEIGDGNESQTIVNNTIPFTFSVNTTDNYPVNIVNTAEINLNTTDTDTINMPGPSSASLATVIEGDTSTEIKTVSEKKLQTSSILLSPEEASVDADQDGFTDLSENEIMDMAIFSDMINLLCCPNCKQTGVKILHQKRYGLATKCKMYCQYCSFEKVFWSSQKVETGRAFDVNRRMVYALRSVGIGHSGAKTFLSRMNLPPPVSRTAYAKIQEQIHTAVVEVASDVMADAAQEVREVAGVTCEDADDVVDTSISCDGTWQKRGFSSLNGAVAVISIETGKVLDVEPMSRYCNACVANDKLKDIDPAKYETFQASHACRNNHKGSAPAMEKDGTIRIFKRSIDRHKLRYMNFYGDGDTKSFYAIEDIYPKYRKVKKFECIGHVQKRMGKRLRQLKKTVRGLGGAGRLTDAMIDKLQNYYGIAIRRNTGKGIKNMKKSIWGAFFHVASSKNNVWHDHCEPGPDSWCKYQVDLVNKTSTYKPGPGLKEDVIKHIKPILNDLSRDDLLEKCLHGKTQNQNESFNGTIWNRIPKTTYVGKQQFEIGVYDAVAHFNVGSKAAVLIYEKLGMRPGMHMLQGSVTKDVNRIENSKRQSTEAKKLRRRYLRASKKHSTDKNKAKEGKVYGAGAF